MAQPRVHSEGGLVADMESQVHLMVQLMGLAAPMRPLLLVTG